MAKFFVRDGTEYFDPKVGMSLEDKEPELVELEVQRIVEQIVKKVKVEDEE
jgi:hypothetical protein